VTSDTPESGTGLSPAPPDEGSPAPAADDGPESQAAAAPPENRADGEPTTESEKVLPVADEAGAPTPAAIPAPRGAAFAALPLAVAGGWIMLEQLERVFAHEAGARSGDDPEDVHRMRVATRRLRAARRVFATAMTEVVDLARADAELKVLATALGRVRDLDVFAIALRRLARAAPEADRPALRRMVAAQKRERTMAQVELRAVLDAGELTYLRGAFHHTLRALTGRPGDGRTPPAPEQEEARGTDAGAAGEARDAQPVRLGRRARRKTVARCAPRLIAKALRKLHRREPTLLAPTSEELHDTRIMAKRARYACEFFAPAYGTQLDEVITTLTAIQDTLGAVHDADVAAGVALGTISGLSDDPRHAADAGPLARLTSRYLAERDPQLLAFREQWAAVPRPDRLRRTVRPTQ
jgi:CHAD domain-containing protein